MVSQAPKIILKIWIGFATATLSHYVYVETQHCMTQLVVIYHFTASASTPQ